jgi:uncharacterized damage-inducible protein DinB
MQYVAASIDGEWIAIRSSGFARLSIHKYGGMMINHKAAIAVFLFVLPAFAIQAKKHQEEHRTVTEVLDNAISNMEREFVSAADAMPEDKFGFAPTNGEFKGVRTYGEQIKHVAAVNYIFGAGILGEKVPVDVGDEAGPASMNAKAEIMNYLKDSFAYVHKAIQTINANNLVEPIKSPFGEGKVTRLGIATSVCSHGFDHYGQMVEYLRMNGIVPPASR